MTSEGPLQRWRVGMALTTMSLAAYLRSRVFDRAHTEERLLNDLVDDLHSANYVMVDQLDGLFAVFFAAIRY